jgi:hypothetical protein
MPTLRTIHLSKGIDANNTANGIAALTAASRKAAADEQAKQPTSYVSLDQVVPSMNLVNPSTVGTANAKRNIATVAKPAGVINKKRVAAAAATVTRVLTAITAVHDAANSTDPALQAYADKLLNNPKFMAALSAAVQEVSDGLSAAHAHPDAGPNASPNNRTSAIPGMDHRRDMAPGSYTVADMHRDLADENQAVEMALKRNPSAGRQAAADASVQVVPAWDSALWSQEARKAYRELGMYNGKINARIAEFDYPARPLSDDEFDALLSRFGAKQ